MTGITHPEAVGPRLPSGVATVGEALKERCTAEQYLKRSALGFDEAVRATGPTACALILNDHDNINDTLLTQMTS